METYFEKNFSPSEEEMQAIDALISKIGDEINKNSITVLDPVRLEQIKFCYAVLQYIKTSKDATVSYKLNEPFNTTGSVSIEGPVLEFNNSEWFARAAEFASNMEVYPLTNGNVRLTFTFHGLTKPIK